jgi:adenylate kinase family enzyme
MRSWSAPQSRSDKTGLMRRVSVVGCPGSGKSTFGAALAHCLDVPYVELDGLFHRPNWGKPEPSEFAAQVTGVVEQPAWVIDGNFSETLDLVWSRADTIVWLDLSFFRVMGRVIRRTVSRVTHQTELWNGNHETWRSLVPFNPQQSIIAWSYTRFPIYKKRYGAVPIDPRWVQIDFVRLRTPSAVDGYLARVKGTTTDTGEAGATAINMRGPHERDGTTRSDI